VISARLGSILPTIVVQLLVLTLPMVVVPSLGHDQAAPIAKSCKVDAPDSWRGYSVQWEGPCESGIAEGLGALRAYQNQKVVEAFYGKVKAGQISFGVMETSDGYLAGKFVSGHLVKDQDRNTIISAFREGASGATAASESFSRKGNESSARYYKKIADRLASQMD
jgi:hypothetical protein